MRFLYKISLKKIKKSIGRFLSIVCIVALGVGFFAGLRETAPDILTTLDNYYDSTNLMDFKIVSTKGLTDDDVSALKDLSLVDNVVASYSVDALVSGEAIRVHTLEKDINQVKLLEGKMPTKENEVLADATKYKIGDTIVIDKVSVDNLSNLEYKVVGLVNSSLYLGREKGIAQIGSGKLESFIFVLKDNFDSEVYTEIYLTTKGAKNDIVYQKDYQTKIDALEKDLYELKPIEETRRYEEILEQATKEIQKIEKEFLEEKAKAESELKKTKIELDSNRETLKQEKKRLSDSNININNQEKQVLEELKKAELKIIEGKNKYQEALKSYNINEKDIPIILNELNNQIETLVELLNSLDINDPNYEDYQNNLNELKQQQVNLNQLIETKEELEILSKNLEQEKSSLNNRIMAARNKINSAEVQLSESEQKLNQGYQEYNEGVKKLELETKEANKKITEAKDELSKIEKPVWYLSNRTDNNGYTSIWDDALKVDSIAKVFPIFFIFVVALMCFNTMNRMVEEERGEIGILASLGYNNFKIINGYLFYVFFSTVIGVTSGLLIGYTAIPTIVYSIYNANYILPKLIITIKIIPFIIMVLIALILMALITIVSCYKELKNAPALILRPKAPKAGKKVLFERITFLWKRLSFIGKVTARNMFRYKKRIIMTVLGIAGCSALLLTGFGLRDSINSLADLQYGNIIHYDSLFVFNNNYKSLDTDTINKLKNDGIEEFMPIYQEAFTFEAKNITHDVSLMVLSEPNNLDRFLSLKSKTKKENKFPTEGVIITEKMAKLLDIKVGDIIKIRNSKKELFVLPVSDIVENYTLHYIYMNSTVYEKIFEAEVNYNMLLANINKSVDKEKLANKWIETENISTINFTYDNIKTFDRMIKGLNKIVYLIIGASCMLAFVVLYNLTTINITERVREISTLKVLGFRDREVSSYVYRETLLLTIIGIAFGLLGGVLLHKYVMDVAETDNILFLHKIHFISYILSFIITIFFGIVVQIFTHFKLKKIDMIESLKSVE